MNALWKPRPVLRAMAPPDLNAVLGVEHSAYRFPWSRGNFIDSLAAGYLAQLLLDEQGELLGYFVAMAGVDEMHLLNLTVAPAQQRRGHARFMLDTLAAQCRAQRAGRLWLEVRCGNQRARQVYARYGFAEVGLRRAYYPAQDQRREDAIVMSLALDRRGNDGLD